MGIPVKLKVDGFTYLGEAFNKGDIFDAPHETMASFMCEQEGTASRVDEKKLAPEKVGTMKREMKGEYNTKVMSPGDNKEPVKTKTGKARTKKVKATANAAENS